MVLQTEITRQKKSFPLEIYRRIYPVGDSVTHRRIHTSVKLSVSVWNTDRRYSSVHSSVIVVGTVKYRRIMSIGKVVGECEIPTKYIRL
jgi:hypothetical protein